MRKTRVWITVGFCFFFMATFAAAQANRKPGLWEMTSTMTWQQSPMPGGMTMPGGGAHTTQVCITQDMIDKYGAPVPQSRNNQCQVANVQMKPGGMTADWICTGPMAGKGTVEGSWTDSDHSTSKVHFLGSMQMGPNATPIEYTISATSAYKGSDCGSVKPIVIPDK
jgi:Protein of unknown function (DUF3617)